MFRIWPAISKKITSEYGPRGDEFHKGIDIAHDTLNDYAIAVSNGRVVKAYYSNSYGYTIVIEHDGYCTLYAHLKKLLVEQGQPIVDGQVVGIIGNTGNSNGVHLHFETRNGKYYADTFFDKKDTGESVNGVDPMCMYIDEPETWEEKLERCTSAPDAWIKGAEVAYGLSDFIPDLAIYKYFKELIIKL